MAQIKLSQAKELCTAAELKLVEASRRDELASLSAKQLKGYIDRARKLRDKWRDVATKQRRDTQSAQNARVTSRNERSAKKAELFGEVLARFEARLPKAEAAEAKAAKSAARGQADGKPGKKGRALEHRARRADTRSDLEAQRAELDAKSTRQAKAKKNRPPATPAPAESNSPTETAPADDAAAKKQARNRKPPATTAGKKALQRLPESDALSKRQQQAVKTAAKAARVKASGLTSRVRGHVSAATKRNQTRRDARN